MSFDLAHFTDTNKRYLIWAAFFLLLYLVRALFGLLFLTFILCFIFNNLIRWLRSKTRMPRRVGTVAVYLVFLVAIAALLSLVGPRVGVETTFFIRQLPETIDTLHAQLDRAAGAQPNLAPMVASVKETLSIKTLSGMNREALLSFAVRTLNQLTHYLSFFLLGTLFSFLILFDFPNLRQKTLALRRTRFRAIYEETSDSVARFALVVGEAFQAQILIACVNTALTALGLWGLHIHPVALLSSIVFFCGLIPVLGTFISSTPILLLAFNQGGAGRALEALVMIIVIHTIETYVLNPRIVSAVLKINPVLTLIILYLGYSLFGFWGVLLGVPITVYIYRFVILGQSALSGTADGEQGGG
jgi:predicted PurR-regulated permease PerM